LPRNYTECVGRRNTSGMLLHTSFCIKSTLPAFRRHREQCKFSATTLPVPSPIDRAVCSLWKYRLYACTLSLFFSLSPSLSLSVLRRDVFRPCYTVNLQHIVCLLPPIFNHLSCPISFFLNLQQFWSTLSKAYFLRWHKSSDFTSSK